ncbi:MAG: Asp-tRNA(Asn)/Glu-tRNA(Gln) amidotransferase subunit GatC [bacterium]
MSITLEDVRHIASLARLGLSEQRAESVATELNTILSHMDALSTVNTEGVAEAVGSGVRTMPLRDDASAPIPLVRPLESFAPSLRDGLLLVPRLSSHETVE